MQAGSCTADMPIRELLRAQKATPTGDPKFVVDQAIPGPSTAEVCDPFLMCDHFGPRENTGKSQDPDHFPVGWHPHRGMDILTYMVKGRGRHADSLGNRESFMAPGMQWMSVGSGVEHAEGGGAPPGEMQEGFQIWVNVPSARKMDDPRYGTVQPEQMPLLPVGKEGSGVSLRLLAGSFGGRTGPFKTVQDVQMLDFEIDAGSTAVYEVPPQMHTCLVYSRQGTVTLPSGSIPERQIAHMAAQGPERTLRMTAGQGGAKVLVFAGVPLRQPIAWHGPFVMTTNEEIEQTIRDYRRGEFPPKRVNWNYRMSSARPKQ
eukprot:Hpha_TRINITY_DN13987_c0_g8::TRINITY_DN13987_c0_g8_i1::g.35988::m.35988/K06911/K06911; uncharacterized protein